MISESFKYGDGVTVNFDLVTSTRGLPKAVNITLFKMDGIITAELCNNDACVDNNKAITNTTKFNQQYNKTEMNNHTSDLSDNCQEGLMNNIHLSKISNNNTDDEENKLIHTLLKEDQEFSRLRQIDIIERTPGVYFLFEETRKFHLLLDTGATHSLLPSKTFSSKNNHKEIICGVTGTSMTTCGKITLSLDFGLSTKFEHDFLIADLSYPYGILGIDFLAQNNFQICFASSTLTHLPTKSFVELEKTCCDARSIRKMSELSS